jgi:hypothetical protein
VPESEETKEEDIEDTTPEEEDDNLEDFNK